MKKRFGLKSIILTALIIIVMTSIGCVPDEGMDNQQINHSQQTIFSALSERSTILITNITPNQQIHYGILGTVTAIVHPDELNNLNELDLTRFQPQALSSQCNAIIGIRIVPYVHSINGQIYSDFIIYGTAVIY